MTAIQPNGYDRIEHDDTYNSKNVKLVASTATIYAVVNTSVGGQASIVVDGPVSIKGNITIDSGSVAITSAPTIYAVVNTGAAVSSNVTLDPGSKTGIVGNVTLSDSKTYIGLVTATIGNTVSTNFAGNVTLDAGSKTQIAGNVTISDSKGFIGLVTVVQGSVARTITGNVTLSNSQNFIGLVTVVQSSAARSILGNVCLSSQVAWANPNTYIGLATVTAGRGHQFMGLVTVVQSSAARSITGNLTITSGTVSLAGNLTLSDAKTFIGLTTAVMGSTVTTAGIQLSYYNQSSLVSGYVYHGFATPGSNPTTASFRIQREVLNTGEVLFGSGAPTFAHQWSSASLASLTYL